MTGQRQLVETAAQATVALSRVIMEARSHDEKRKAARREEKRLRAERAAAIWHLGHDFHLENTVISREIITELHHLGLTDREITRLGVSHDTVRRITKGHGV